MNSYEISKVFVYILLYIERNWVSMKFLFFK